MMDQRERTRRLHLKDVANYVHLPITEAAKELQICPTALKKVCRKHGMLRWPYRKVSFCFPCTCISAMDQRLVLNS